MRERERERERESGRKKIAKGIEKGSALLYLVLDTNCAIISISHVKTAIAVAWTDSHAKVVEG